MAARPSAFLVSAQDEAVLLPGVPAASAIPKAASSVLARVLAREEGLVVLARAAELTKKIEGVRLLPSPHP